MKVEIVVDDKADDLGIVVTCRQLTPEIEKLLETLRMMDHQLTAKKNEETYLLDIADVVYIESVDRKCFVYTADEVYETDFRLYELERQLEEFGFLRVSKSFLIHLQKVKSLKADINRKIRITMSSGEQIIASRQYAVICAAGHYHGKTGLLFMGIMAVGILISLLVGAVIGIWSKTEMMATSITVPVMMVFSFLPMLSLFNDRIAKIAGFVYSEQISRMLRGINSFELTAERAGVMGVNILIAALAFTAVFRKRGLS